VVLVFIDKNGKWFLSDNFKSIGDEVVLIPGGKGKMANLSNPRSKVVVDLAFPVLHGSYGEDGSMQGLLKLADIPFVGSGVLGSAMGMDKDFFKKVLRDAGIPIGRFFAFSDIKKCDFDFLEKKLGLPFFVKPASLGSSVGVRKVKSKDDFLPAIEDAFLYDKKILIEEFMDARELECSVLGNKEPKASAVGEVVVNAEFYSYDAKYTDENGAKLIIPADISKETAREIQDLAVKTFKAISCEGLGRVDFFLRKDGKIFVNEINTIPGFTSISMYPKLWQASGLDYKNLIDELIRLAFERFEKERLLKVSI
ncbi:D-alanine--D-alanine ligase, partial [Candidatus Azambacteria bacterium]|nr:D-alanine--D-alanine ligase [Candidatus Azambacteria bacterium]